MIHSFQVFYFHNEYCLKNVLKCTSFRDPIQDKNLKWYLIISVGSQSLNGNQMETFSLTVMVFGGSQRVQGHIKIAEKYTYLAGIET